MKLNKQDQEWEDNLAERGDDGDSVNDQARDNQKDLLLEAKDFATKTFCAICRSRAEKKGLWGYWHCFFEQEKYAEKKRMSNWREVEPEIEIAF